MRRGTVLSFAVVVALLLCPAAPANSRASPTHRFAASSIALSPDGSTLIVTNSDSNTITLVDTAAQVVIAEIPVGLDPRSVAIAPDGGLAYVANQGSDEVSVIDLDAGACLDSLPAGDRPVGVAVSPDGRLVAVAELGADQVRLVDAATLQTWSLLPTLDRPYGLAFTSDGKRLLVTHLLSGEVTLFWVQAYRTYLPTVLKGQGTRSVNTASRSQSLISDLQSQIPTWSNVAPAPGVVINAAGTRAYLPQTMANGQGYNTAFDTTVFPQVSVLDLETSTHVTAEKISLPETDQPVGLPWAATLARAGTELWVVNAASNDVSVIDISVPKVPVRTAHILVGDNPRGIVLSPDGSVAYVDNALAGTVSVIDTQAYTVTATITATTLPLPPCLLRGKRLFFSSAERELAQARWISCNTCHVEGELDGRTWKLQYLDPVPPGEEAVVTRNTTSLLGMIETYPLRWSAEWDESADSEFSVRFEQFGTGLIEGDMHPTLGEPNQGRSYDLDCLAMFIDSLGLPPRAHSLGPAELRGKALFESASTGCADCHPAPLYTDLLQHDVGTADGPGEWFGPVIDTPTLRFLYDAAPFLHDGSAATLGEVLTVKNPDDEHGTTSHLSEQELGDLIAFLWALPYQ
ncbi:MAG: beta-propeller fold lactonase family protein [Anaerolineae bacterium]|nr:beta-propeller fold lactonase family protein [Anaerolineae bacterium]